jgi:hypothetical protein
MPSEQNWLRRRGSKFFAPPSSMMISQKVPGWLSKNFDMPGVVYFCDRGHTCGMPKEQKCATTPEIGLFATPSFIKDNPG